MPHWFLTATVPTKEEAAKFLTENKYQQRLFLYVLGITPEARTLRDDEIESIAAHLATVSQTDVWRPSANRQTTALDRYGGGKQKALTQANWVELIVVWRFQNRRGKKSTGYDEKKVRKYRERVFQVLTFQRSSASTSSRSILQPFPRKGRDEDKYNPYQYHYEHTYLCSVINISCQQAQCSSRQKGN